MLTQNEMQQIIEYTAAKGAEFSELFLEDRADQEIRYADGSVQAVKNVHIYGAGLRLINGTEAIYTYTNDVSIKGLKSLADEALSLLSSKHLASQLAPQLRALPPAHSNACPLSVVPRQVKDFRKPEKRGFLLTIDGPVVLSRDVQNSVGAFWVTPVTGGPPAKDAADSGLGRNSPASHVPAGQRFHT